MRPRLLGIEIGGTKLQVGIGYGDGRLLDLERRRIDPSRGAAGIRQQISEAVEAVRTRMNGSGDSIAAVGIGFGGPVDSTGGRVIRSHQISGWDEFPIVEWARGSLGIPIVALENDADTAALGEACFGAGRGVSPVLYVNSGSGVGGGLIIDGRIYRGGSGFGALEIGHLRVFLDGPNSSGRLDFAIFQFEPRAERILEDVASGWSIARAGALFLQRRVSGGQDLAPVLAVLSEGRPDRVTAEMVARAATLDDAEAIGILDDATSAMAQALAHAVTLLAPRRIVLGGGVSLIEDRYWIEPIRRKLIEQVFEPFRSTYDVVPAALGQDVVVHGALAVAREAHERSSQSP